MVDTISASVLLTNTAVNGGDPVRILCSAVIISGIKNNSRQPNVNANSQAEVQTQTYENLKFSVQGVHFTGEDDTLSPMDVLILYTQKYNGANTSTLNINYGDYPGNSVAGLLMDTDISVVMDGSFQIPIDVTSSKNGRTPIGSINFVETK